MPRTPDRTGRGSAGLPELAGSAAAIVAVLVAVGLAVPSMLAPDNVTFADHVLDLKLNGQDSIQETIGEDNFAPGDSEAATIAITGEGEIVLETDLDIGMTYHDEDADFALELYFSEMVYGEDDLLADPGRNLITEVDQSRLGNGDGKLQVQEFQLAGIDDLPPPGDPDDPTLYELEVAFPPEVGNEFQGRAIDLTFIFFWSDTTEDDLD